MRLITRIPADRGRVAAVTVRLAYEGTADSDAVDVTDVQLQPGEPSGVVPSPADVPTRQGGVQWRNGVIPKSTDEVIVLSNGDAAAPTRVEVAVTGTGSVRVGSFRFGTVYGSAYADGRTRQLTRGWGRPPVLTERSDGHVAVTTSSPVHVSVGWLDRH